MVKNETLQMDRKSLNYCNNNGRKGLKMQKW